MPYLDDDQCTTHPAILGDYDTQLDYARERIEREERCEAANARETFIRGQQKRAPAQNDVLTEVLRGLDLRTVTREARMLSPVVDLLDSYTNPWRPTREVRHVTIVTGRDG